MQAQIMNASKEIHQPLATQMPSSTLGRNACGSQWDMGSDTNYLPMLHLVASFCPVCLTTMTEKTTFIINQDLRLLTTYLSWPCSALEVLLSCSLIKWNCCNSPCAPSACDTD